MRVILSVFDLTRSAFAAWLYACAGLSVWIYTASDFQTNASNALSCNTLWSTRLSSEAFGFFCALARATQADGKKRRRAGGMFVKLVYSSCQYTIKGISG